MNYIIGSKKEQLNQIYCRFILHLFFHTTAYYYSKAGLYE